MTTPQPGCSCANLWFLAGGVAGGVVGARLAGVGGALLGFPAGFLLALGVVWIVAGAAILAEHRSKPKP